MITRRIGLRSVLAGAALGAALVLAAITPTHAEETLKFGWVTADTPTDPYAIVAREFKKNVEAATEGEVAVQLFPNRQLGDEKEILEGIRFGTVDAGVVTNAVVANVDKALQINDLPFLYSNEAEAHEVLDGELGQDLLKRLETKGLIGLGFCEGGFRHMINNTRPVEEPGDVEGVKYRVMQNPVYIGMFSSLGGNAVPMAWGEVFPAVQQGALDGLEIPIMVINSTKMYEITKYLSLTNHTYSAILLLVSKRSFEKLTPEQQSAVRKAGTVTCATQRSQNAANVEKTLEELKAKGMQINQIKDVSAFRDAVKSVYDRFRSDIGDERLDAFLKAVN